MIVGGDRLAATASAAAMAASATAVACRLWRRRRSVCAGRGPVHQIGPGQSVAVDIVIGLFAISVRRFGRAVGGRCGLATHLRKTQKTNENAD